MLENTKPVPGNIENTDIVRHSKRVAQTMKAMSHEVRLSLLWHLSKGEKAVSELSNLHGLEQSTISQQLARLRLEGIVEPRRDGRLVYYRISDPRALNLLEIIGSIYGTANLRKNPVTAELAD